MASFGEPAPPGALRILFMVDRNGIRSSIKLLRIHRGIIRLVSARTCLPILLSPFTSVISETSLATQVPINTRF